VAVVFDGDTLSYTSSGRRFTASFRDGCTIDGTHLAAFDYVRHESKYARVRRDPAEFRIEFEESELLLDFDRGRRDVR
jgi:hypothetical protein